MRIAGVLLFASTLFATAAVAAPQTPANIPAGPQLAPGKPAGVKQAQMENNTVMAVGAVGLLGLGIGLAASGDSNVITATSTSSTGTTP